MTKIPGAMSVGTSMLYGCEVFSYHPR